MKFIVLVIMLVSPQGDIISMNNQVLISMTHCLELSNTIQYTKNKDLTSSDNTISTYCY